MRSTAVRWNFREYRFRLSTCAPSPAKCAHRECANSRGQSTSTVPRMGKILKGKPLPHVLIADTSILWHKDKGPAVNPDFDTFWAAHKQLVKLELVLPEVVRGELLFQQVT